MKYLITGGCGFIGSHFGDMFFSKYPNGSLTNIDCRSKISNDFLRGKYLNSGFDYTEVCENINTISTYSYPDLPDVVVHFAAESHVDKSLTDVETFIDTNILGTVKVAQYCINNDIPMIYISTDEVYGELGEYGLFNELSHVNPRNPYSVTKASAGFLLQALQNSNPNFKLIITRCSNNFGPRQDGTKLIPVCINSILNGKKIPIYGEGLQVRDWIHVKDHCEAIFTLVDQLVCDPNNTPLLFNIGADNELRNIDLINLICENLGVNSYDAVEFIDDPRKNAHDFRYAIDSARLRLLTGWQPNFTHPFENTLKATVDWYK